MNAPESFIVAKIHHKHTKDETFRVEVCHPVQHGFSFFPHHHLSDLRYLHYDNIHWDLNAWEGFFGVGGGTAAQKSPFLICAAVLSVQAVQDTNDASCFVVNYAGFPECRLNWDSIYSCRMAETWCGERAWLTGINGRNCSKADKVLIP